MVRLSPKALRFAEDATRILVRSPAEQDTVRDWQRVRGEIGAEGQRYVDVPTAVAKVFLAAIEGLEAEMQERVARSEDEEADLGNDLAFLHVIAGSLRSDLGRDA